MQISSGLSSDIKPFVFRAQQFNFKEYYKKYFPFFHGKSWSSDISPSPGSQPSPSKQILLAPYASYAPCAPYTPHAI